MFLVLPFSMLSKGSLAIYLTLASILFLALFLRVKDLSNNPPGFYTDEASIGYNAYKILTTGRDEHGKFLPVFFEAFGEYKNPLAIYPVVPSIAIFGANEFAVRVVQAIWGVLTVAMIFFLGREIFGSKGGILSAFILAISPWHIHLSRFNIESHGAFLFFVSGGLLFTVIAVRKKFQLKFLVLASIFWGFSFYTYFATRIFTPLFLAGLAVIFLPELVLLFKKYRKNLLISLVVFFIITTPFIVHLISGKAFLRFQQVGFNREERTQNVTSKSLKLYADHFNPKFVFFLGDSDFPGQNTVRHSVSGMGLMYKWQLPLFLIGLVYLILVRNKKWGFKIRSVLILMLLLYPLGSVVSEARTPYATRSVIGLIPYDLLITQGILSLLVFVEKIKPNVLALFARVSFLLVFAYLSVFFLLRFEALSKVYINVASGYNGFQFGMQQIVEYFMENANDFDMMILFSGADGGDAYLKFYSLGNCTKCYWGENEIGRSSDKKLIAVSVNERATFDSRYRGSLLKTIYYPNGQEALEIYKVYD